MYIKCSIFDVDLDHVFDELLLQLTEITLPDTLELDDRKIDNQEDYKLREYLLKATSIEGLAKTKLAKSMLDVAFGK